MTLHILNRSPSDKGIFNSYQAALTADDTLLLIEEAVYWILPHHSASLSGLPARVVVLAPDRAARGVTKGEYEEVDDAGFVMLTLEHERTLSWF
ncbi:sulfurtransferase complex subunit TusB [Marinobacterium weihaiense]|uniref:Sulfurtransferase complex subunit TusB n=1 Tax=Marinobacterium weihaiense TaxID=2851016 RepID=A0ABS6M6B3_9GAMM|nr:sulfurtransferase complex subunit TusB [Marinobacterium weihaiense]MBV0931823.1 sulfurtransferase complex subunit TusB [Marinobacterium weihaiense]